MKKTLALLLGLCLSCSAAETGIASHYSTKDGHKTASGQKLSNTKLTAAHRTLKFGTKVKITNLKTRKSIVVIINDRGPFKKNRIIDVTPAAAKALGFFKSGLAKVTVEIIKK